MARLPEPATVLVCVSLAREDQLHGVAYVLYVRGSLRWAGVVRQLPRPSRSRRAPGAFSGGRAHVDLSDQCPGSQRLAHSGDCTAVRPPLGYRVGVFDAERTPGLAFVVEQQGRGHLGASVGLPDPGPTAASRAAGNRLPGPGGAF